MNELDLDAIFTAILPPGADALDKPVYAVQSVRGYESYFVGKNRESHACLLVATADRTDRPQSPIAIVPVERMTGDRSRRCMTMYPNFGVSTASSQRGIGVM